MTDADDEGQGEDARASEGSNAPAAPLAEADGATEDEAPPESTRDDGELRDLLRGALGTPQTEGPDLLAGFQRKVRERSGGKFYTDGWSTSREPPITTYLLTSLVMLAVVFVVYAILGPLSGAAIEVEPPAPVRIVPPHFVAPERGSGAAAVPSARD